MMIEDTITKVTEGTVVLRSTNKYGGVAFIYKFPCNNNRIFITGDLTIEELQEILTKSKQHNAIAEDNLLKKIFTKILS